MNRSIFRKHNKNSLEFDISILYIADLIIMNDTLHRILTIRISLSTLREFAKRNLALTASDSLLGSLSLSNNAFLHDFHLCIRRRCTVYCTGELSVICFMLV